MKKRVMFLCTGNACRSQMAEGWLRFLAGDRYEVASAGIEAHGLNPDAVLVMAEAGVDISSQTSDILQPEDLQQMDLLITVCGHADQSCPSVPANCVKLHWPFPDPAQASGSREAVLLAFRDVRDQIGDRIRDFLGSDDLETHRQT
ncbi:MAG: arsenate reductase (thioredoxin) [Gammaproteobacteria bacterium]|nr:MAG: arsenate reductase (thioredoxin) [Gammaproteobacteria bacterium]